MEWRGQMTYRRETGSGGSGRAARVEGDARGKTGMEGQCSYGVEPSWVILRWSVGRAGGF
jgi:hypothetical protein